VLGAALWVGFGAIGQCSGGALLLAAVWLVGPALAAGALGMGVRMATRRARCRSSWVAALSALAVAVPFAMGSGWAHVWFYAALADWSPLAQWVGPVMAGAGGVAILVVAPAMCLGAASDTPFCEACAAFADDEGEARFPADRARDVVAALADPAGRAVGSLPRAVDEGPAVRVWWTACPCGALFLVRAEAPLPPSQPGDRPLLRSVFSALVDKERGEALTQALARSANPHEPHGRRGGAGTGPW
jgi:hypothetical protein